MNEIYTDREKIRSQVAEAYYKLPSTEQKIAQLMSVIYEPVAKNTLMSCANRIGLQDENGRPLTIKTFKPLIARLLETGIMVQHSGYGPQCHPLLAEIAARDAVRSGQFDQLVAIVEDCFPITTQWKGRRAFRSQRQFLREVRIGLYRQDLAFINQQFEDYYHHSHQPEKISINEICQQICNNPFDAAWFSTLSPELYELCLSGILRESLMNLTPATEALALVQQDFRENSGRDIKFLRTILIEQFLLRGHLQEARASLNPIEQEYGPDSAVLWGSLTFLEGDAEEAIAHFSVALNALKKISGKSQIFFNTICGLFFILALLQEGSPESLEEGLTYTQLMSKQTGHWLRGTYQRLQQFLRLQQGELAQKDTITQATISPVPDLNSIETLLQSFCLYWVDATIAKKQLPQILEPYYRQAEAAGYYWLGRQAVILLSRLQPRNLYAASAIAQTSNQQAKSLFPAINLVDLIQPQESWELCLNALTQFQAEPQIPAKPEAERRLAWFLTLYPNTWHLQPREQKINSKGIWSKGRNVALKRLNCHPEEFDYLTPQDRQACAFIETYSYGYYGQLEYQFKDRAIAALIGHPLIFWEESPNTRVELFKGQPELLVQKQKTGSLTLQLTPPIEAGQTIVAIKETPTRVKIIEISQEHRRIASILGAENRLDVPATAEERVRSAIAAVSSLLTIHSDIGGDAGTAETVPAQSQPHIHLLPAGTGLKIALLSRPFADGGPYFRPGSGGATVIAEIEGKRLQTTRNLAEEKQRAETVLAACPTLAQLDGREWEWLLQDPEDCLELLLELQALDQAAVLEWPEGEKLRVSRPLNIANLQLEIQQQRNWFAASGELQVDDNLVVDLQRLLELLEQTPSRFIPLGNGQFLALTEEFRQRLDDLRVFSERQGQGIRLHPLAAIAVSDLLEEAGHLEVDKQWKALRKRFQEAQDWQPTLPSTLQAELRDYQLEGFRWLARLAHWGVGACLADDMGLGKTLQALAAILTRAAEGPTLIVAPTSVCLNWMSEAQRFAPTLNPIYFGSGDRQKALKALQPFDLLICSYGLLQQEEVATMLAAVSWQTIVLDEAQAIKNFATKRSQGAMKLQGAFKMIATGTPIENHLGELWNLFRFINPGLLGSLDSFNQRFATPIEKYQDRQARNRLKKLVQPFLLRRTKSEVLTELPPRTEILLQVELSQEEMAFYELLRREAIAKLNASDANAGQKHLQVLAAIMRLRRACCHPRLVFPEAQLSSAKLQLFGELIEELLENRHKVLVFSQFVDHLEIIRNYLNRKKITYQYLDGSIPAAERQQRVNAFQSGVGDVFLISLKAGGTGLNLTAADYVIHMDPWWNPAVEDQASDRAHRIGQQRPVTIYRLVAKGTIEEKIVELHSSKRDLADSLLEGADMSGKISTEQLLRLIQES